MEVLIAMVIMSIGFLALIQVQLGALNGYISARDNTEASELARRIAEMLDVEAAQWRDGGILDGGGNVTLTVVPYADGGSDTPFDVDAPLALAAATPGAWIRLFENPSTVRFGREGMSTASAYQFVPGRYCAYVKGGLSSGSANTIQAQIAVVYPAPKTVQIACPEADSLPADLDDVGSSVSGSPAPPALEGVGFRVVYYGTLVARRRHLRDREF